MCDFEDLTNPPTASLWSGLLTFTYSRGTYSRGTYSRTVQLQRRNTSRNGGEQISAELKSHTSPFCNDYNKLQSFAFWVFVFLFSTRQKLRFHLSYSHSSSLVFDVREPLCVQYENAWHCVAQAATQAKWHNKGTIPIYASAACLPRERWTVL